jgi:hypothetical protein
MMVFERPHHGMLDTLDRFTLKIPNENQLFSLHVLWLQAADMWPRRLSGWICAQPVDR